MKKLRKIMLLIVLFVACSTLTHSQTIKVMTYNIRYDNPDDGLNAWSIRKDYFCTQLKFYAPDILGVQEGLEHQLKYIDSSLVSYRYVGVGRDDGQKKGEHSAIFYNAQKFKLIKQSTFWLSETPDVVSKGWDAALNRVCTYALLECKNTKQQFWVFNTHLDYLGELSRNNSAKLIIARIKSLNKANNPVLLMGDFNSEPTTYAIKYISETLNNSKQVCQGIVFGPDGSFNGFEFDKPVIKLLDYVFTDKKRIRVNKYAVLSDSKDCRYPSDHLPVYVEMTFVK